MAKSLDYWRGYFSGANADICDIIENAVIVAALDYPKDFKLRRAHIAELLFTCNLAKCFGCDKVEVSVPTNGPDGETLVEGEKLKSSGEFEEEKERSEEKNANCVGDGHGHAMNVTYEDAEALDDEMEEESRFIQEVLRIKEILDNHQDQSDSMLFDSLKRLELMDLSVEILKATDIGKSVNALKKHGAKKIRDFVRTLIDGWVELLDSWMIATAAIAEETSPESMKTSTIDSGEGLPSPPLDEGAFLTHPMELSGLFDGLDDDGNVRINADVNKNSGSGRKPPVKDGNVPKHKEEQVYNDLFAYPPENKVQQTMKEEIILKKNAAVVNTNKPSSGITGSARPIKTRVEQKVNNETKSQLERDERAVQKKPLAHQDDINLKHREQQSANGAIRKTLLPPQQEKVRSSDEAYLQVKTEATKRKLHERYQEAENAKKQRAIQVMQLHDIKKQGAGRNHKTKPGNYNHNRN